MYSYVAASGDSGGLSYRLLYTCYICFREDEPWLNRTTTCTYPQPWKSRVPPPIPVLAATAGVLPQSTTLRPTTVPARPAAGWLADTHWIYVGRYGHLLLGNFTVSFQPAEGTLDGGMLLFQVCSVV